MTISNDVGQKDAVNTRVTRTARRACSVARLSNRGRYTVFEHGDSRLLFIAPAVLECYLEVTEWDNGYIVVQTKYSISDDPIEEYIDLVPILENLYIDPVEFCSHIDRVVVSND